MKKYLYSAAAITLVILVVLLSRTVVRLENFHYASWVGFCLEEGVVYASNPDADGRRNRCLEQTQTRTSTWTHLFYALTGE
ncbi:hypothetical protein EXS57_03770 [Candidatus Kaiserbacteria bacterium]|nr:hypothetical protein [Candidatus Kaiserbacteria bacterium]